MSDMSEGLAARYEELERVDQDLHRAEQELLAAHLNPGGRQGPRPEVIYAQVLDLRSRSRELLDWLGEQLVLGSEDPASAG
ncbi:MAG: hypothetical protein JWQ13_4117 [Ramlibacter sp.]|jgi:hypothetical protein|nr:hypothetical protein [Ramlibacter sp.]